MKWFTLSLCLLFITAATSASTESSEETESTESGKKDSITETHLELVTNSSNTESSSPNTVTSVSITIKSDEDGDDSSPTTIKKTAATTESPKSFSTTEETEDYSEDYPDVEEDEEFDEQPPLYSTSSTMPKKSKSQVHYDDEDGEDEKESGIDVKPHSSTEDYGDYDYSNATEPPPLCEIAYKVFCYGFEPVCSGDGEIDCDNDEKMENSPKKSALRTTKEEGEKDELMPCRITGTVTCEKPPNAIDCKGTVTCRTTEGVKVPERFAYWEVALIAAGFSVALVLILAIIVALYVSYRNLKVEPESHEKGGRMRIGNF